MSLSVAQMGSIEICKDLSAPAAMTRGGGSLGSGLAKPSVISARHSPEPISFSFSQAQAPPTAFEWMRHPRGAWNEKNLSALVLVVSRHANMAEVGAAKKAGGDYVIAKPIAPAVLLGRPIWAARQEGRAAHDRSASGALEAGAI